MWHCPTAVFLRLMFVVSGILVSGGCGEQQQPPPQKPPTVTVGKPLSREVVEWDRYTGRIEAIERVEIRSQVGGYLKKIHFNEGSMVKQGELLYELDDRLFQATVAKAEAGVDQAEAALEQAKAQRLQVKARQILAQQRLERGRELIQNRSISEEDWETRQSEALQVEADIKAADSAIETARQGVKTAEAALRDAEVQLGYATIRAPFSGRIGERLVTEGNLISAGNNGNPPLTTLIALDPIHCVFDADEQAYLKYVRLAESGERASSRDTYNPVYIRLGDEEKFGSHRGHMDFVNNEIDQDTATIQGRAIFRNPDKVLTPGLFARVRIPGTSPYPALLVPDSSVLSDQSIQFVFTVNSEGIVGRKNVTTGPLAYGLRVIESGLEPSDRVVTAGMQMIQPEMPVNAVDEPIEPKTGEYDQLDITPFEEPIERTIRPILPSGPEGDTLPEVEANDETGGEPQPTVEEQPVGEETNDSDAENREPPEPDRTESDMTERE